VALFGSFVFAFLSGAAFAAFARRHIYPVFAVGREYAVEAGQIYSRFRHQRRQLGNDKLAGKPICTTRIARRVEHRDVRHEIQWLKDDVRGAIAVGHFELIRNWTPVDEVCLTPDNPDENGADIRGKAA
jgi:hypothetical protein